MNYEDRTAQPPFQFQHTVGMGILHRGRHMHQAMPISSGHRLNLILWARSSAWRTQNGCAMCGKRDGLFRG